MHNNKTFFALLLAAFVGLGAFYGYKIFLYYQKKQIAGPGAPVYAIYVEPDDSAPRAAADYLSWKLQESLGTEFEIVTEKEEGRTYLCILSGSGPDSPEEAAVTLDDLATIEKSDYTISLEKDDVVIRIPRRSRCFGTVKAVAEQWLQPDCGIKDGTSLYISQAMIARQLSSLSTSVTGGFRVLTQNLRYTDDKGGNSVEERSKRFTQLIEEYQPDLIGTQECTYQWLQLMDEALSDRYTFFGCSRLGSQSNEEEWNAILFRKDRFTLLDGKTFWLSNTPSEEASKLNYDGCVRICTWALLQDRETGKTFLFANTHLQDGNSSDSQEIRRRQIEILLQHLNRNNWLTRYPGILTGDFNAESDEAFYPVITSVFDDANYSAVQNSSKVDYSFHYYGEVKQLIDYCFHSTGNVTALDYQILDKQYDGYVSDHYGILVTAVLN